MTSGALRAQHIAGIAPRRPIRAIAARACLCLDGADHPYGKPGGTGHADVSRYDPDEWSASTRVIGPTRDHLRRQRLTWRSGAAAEARFGRWQPRPWRAAFKRFGPQSRTDRPGSCDDRPQYAAVVILGAQLLPVDGTKD